MKAERERERERNTGRREVVNPMLRREGVEGSVVFQTMMEDKRFNPELRKVAGIVMPQVGERFKSFPALAVALGEKPATRPANREAQLTRWRQYIHIEKEAVGNGYIVTSEHDFEGIFPEIGGKKLVEVRQWLYLEFLAKFANPVIEGYQELAVYRDNNQVILGLVNGRFPSANRGKVSEKLKEFTTVSKRMNNQLVETMLNGLSGLASIQNTPGFEVVFTDTDSESKFLQLDSAPVGGKLECLESRKAPGEQVDPTVPLTGKRILSSPAAVGRIHTVQQEVQLSMGLDLKQLRGNRMKALYLMGKLGEYFRRVTIELHKQYGITETREVTVVHFNYSTVINYLISAYPNTKSTVKLMRYSNSHNLKVLENHFSTAFKRYEYSQNLAVELNGVEILDKPIDTPRKGKTMTKIIPTELTGFLKTFISLADAGEEELKELLGSAFSKAKSTSGGGIGLGWDISFPGE